ncbi:hypothetical protein [Rhodohalobacter sp. SW132]|uniref:hypothetical protein n=1 Tax=Rhodohalobacter sp. SW132 TaxID=2293433 RepID=UPI001314FC84|nr:hypothetical protein [Rhodohalobacter sp. SW132]
MKVIGIVVLLSGIIFTLYTFLSVPEITTPTSGLEPWIGLLVIATGAATVFKAWDE